MSQETLHRIQAHFSVPRLILTCERSVEHSTSTLHVVAATARLAFLHGDESMYVSARVLRTVLLRNLKALLLVRQFETAKTSTAGSVQRESLVARGVLVKHKSGEGSNSIHTRHTGRR